MWELCMEQHIRKMSSSTLLGHMRSFDEKLQRKKYKVDKLKKKVIMFNYGLTVKAQQEKWRQNQILRS